MASAPRGVEIQGRRCLVVCRAKRWKPTKSRVCGGASAMLGANLGIDDLDVVMHLEKMCDNLGLDTMEMGAALGVAGDAGVLTFGDGPGALELLEEVSQGTVLGRVLGQGAAITARVFGLSRVPVVKGQAIPAHDPRKEIGTGIGYATNPQGADHTGVIIFQAENTAEMVETSRQKQINTCAYDSMGLCQMAETTPEVIAIDQMWPSEGNTFNS
ncbi:hypothetical protein LCGC14_2287390, partial [marine sediment metagenome]